jgi:hypothetical protein
MRNRKLTVALATALTAASIGVTSAGAKPIDDPMAPTVNVTQPAGVNGGHGPAGASHVTESPSATAPSSDGFDWGDAAIGAGAALGMLGLGAAATSTFRRSRSGHPAMS